MGGQRDGADRPNAPGLAARSRGGRGHGGLRLASSWTLSASEIGAYAFCPQAWFLDRCRLPVTAVAEARRRAGSRAHRDIGRQTDLLRAVGALRTVLLVAVAVLLLLLAAVLWRGLA